VVFVTSGLNYEHNIKHFVEDATVYADSAGEKLKGTAGELEALSADLHGRIAGLNAKLSELQEAERELAGLYAEARSADAELELSYLRIRSMENADSREAEYLAKSSGEAADKAGAFSVSVLEKLRALREKLGM
jgi:peptidoglycan hydrolase CwlO-like protein